MRIAHQAFDRGNCFLDRRLDAGELAAETADRLLREAHEARHQSHFVRIRDHRLLRRRIAHQLRRIDEPVLLGRPEDHLIRLLDTICPEHRCKLEDRDVVQSFVRIHKIAKVARRGVVRDLVLGLSIRHLPHGHERQRSKQRSILRLRARGLFDFGVAKRSSKRD